MKIYYTLILCMGILTTQQIVAQENNNCQQAQSFSYLIVNEVLATVSSAGPLWWDHSSNPTYLVPSQSYSNVLFSGGLWMAGKDNSGILRVAGLDNHNWDYWPGPIINETTDSLQCSKYDVLYNVFSKEIKAFLEDGTLTDDLKYYPGKDNPLFSEKYETDLPQQENYAPFIDVNNDGIYNIKDGDYPDIDGDQSIYSIMNDIGNTRKAARDSKAMGLEIKTTAYAIANTSTVLDTVTFYRFEVTNKSQFTYKDFCFGFKVDPDLGQYQDDYVGVDTLRNFGYVYNGDYFDEGSEGFETDIPLAALVLLDAPYTNKANESKLGAFMYHNNDFTDFGNPDTLSEHYYSYLKARWKNGAHLTKGGDGTDERNPATNFAFPNNPDDTSEESWSECGSRNDPSDRNFILTAKPLTTPFYAGETIKFEFAVVTSFGFRHPCPNIKQLQKNVDFVQDYYDNNIKEQVVGITHIEQSKNVNIYPNPIQDQIIIESALHFKLVELYDMNGKLLIQKLDNPNTIQINQSTIDRGVYILKLTTSDSVSFNQKIVVK